MLLLLRLFNFFTDLTFTHFRFTLLIFTLSTIVSGSFILGIPQGLFRYLETFQHNLDKFTLFELTTVNCLIYPDPIYNGTIFSVISTLSDLPRFSLSNTLYHSFYICSDPIYPLICPDWIFSSYNLHLLTYNFQLLSWILIPFNFIFCPIVVVPLSVFSNQGFSINHRTIPHKSIKKYIDYLLRWSRHNNVKNLKM